MTAVGLFFPPSSTEPPAGTVMVWPPVRADERRGGAGADLHGLQRLVGVLLFE